MLPATTRLPFGPTSAIYQAAAAIAYDVYCKYVTAKASGIVVLPEFAKSN